MCKYTSSTAFSGCHALQGASELCSKARDAGLIVITAGKGDVVRLVPPLVVSDEDIDKCCQILGQVAREVLI